MDDEKTMKRPPIVGCPIGKVLSEIAAVRGWTQTRLAEQLGFADPKVITKYLRGPSERYGATPEPERVEEWIDHIQALGPDFSSFPDKLRAALKEQRQWRRGPKRDTAAAANPSAGLLLSADEAALLSAFRRAPLHARPLILNMVRAAVPARAPGRAPMGASRMTFERNPRSEPEGAGPRGEAAEIAARAQELVVEKERIAEAERAKAAGHAKKHRGKSA